MLGRDRHSHMPVFERNRLQCKLSVGLHNNGMVLLNQIPLLHLVRGWLTRDNDMLPVCSGRLGCARILCPVRVIRILPIERGT